MKEVSRGVWLGSAALLLFAAWCALLAWDVVQLRAGLETHVGWLIELQSVQKDAADEAAADTVGRLDVLVGEAEGSPVAAELRAVRDAWSAAAALPAVERSAAITEEIDVAVRAIRRQTGSLSVELGAHWDSLNVLVVAALLLGAFALMLLHLADRRHRRAEELRRALQVAERRRTLLLARVSHDLRTPLSAVMVANDLLVDMPRLAEVEHADRLLRIMQRSAETLAVLVDDLQALSRMDRGELKIRSEPVSVRTLLDRCGEIASALAHGEDLRIVQSVQAGLADRWLGDEHRLRQVLLNLLGNAIKFSSSGDIVLSVRESPRGGLRFQVADQGKGIAPEQLSGIFHPWQRGEDVADPDDVEGSGLGLSICRDLVERMGGTISVQSEVGVGTEVTVDLGLQPLPQPEDPALESTGPDRPLPRTTH